MKNEKNNAKTLMKIGLNISKIIPGHPNGRFMRWYGLGLGLSLLNKTPFEGMNSGFFVSQIYGAGLGYLAKTKDIDEKNFSKKEQWKRFAGYQTGVATAYIDKIAQTAIEYVPIVQNTLEGLL